MTFFRFAKISDSCSYQDTFCSEHGFRVEIVVSCEVTFPWDHFSEFPSIWELGVPTKLQSQNQSNHILTSYWISFQYSKNEYDVFCFAKISDSYSYQGTFCSKHGMMEEIVVSWEVTFPWDHFSEFPSLWDGKPLPQKWDIICTQLLEFHALPLSTMSVRIMPPGGQDVQGTHVPHC